MAVPPLVAPVTIVPAIAVLTDIVPMVILPSVVAMIIVSTSQYLPHGRAIPCPRTEATIGHESKQVAAGGGTVGVRISGLELLLKDLREQIVRIFDCLEILTVSHPLK